eukprot:TRINITY_DN18512_c0_g1_i2.p1 TRINITY_DN18512_c0_g1~~TRINITY_DN18512_c0_g1_i2.p1  ORF type:complete len:251 (-),score=36.86 TRINITY_DN18512_c0_g1_i2:134-886(-)
MLRKFSSNTVSLFCPSKEFCRSRSLHHFVPLSTTLKMAVPLERKTKVTDFIGEHGAAGWEKLWQVQETPWDIGRAHTALVELVDSDQLPHGRALVPGCGRGYDVLALASPARTAVGLDLSDTALDLARELRAQRGVADTQAVFENKDFFALPEDEKFNVIYDYTFFCAINPSQRLAWAKKMSALIAPGGELVTLIFPVADHQGGPPFAVHPDIYKALLEAEGFRSIFLEPLTNSPASRAGKEYIGRWRKD